MDATQAKSIESILAAGGVKIQAAKFKQAQAVKAQEEAEEARQTARRSALQATLVGIFPLAVQEYITLALPAPFAESADEGAITREPQELEEMQGACLTLPGAVPVLFQMAERDEPTGNWEQVGIYTAHHGKCLYLVPAPTLAIDTENDRKYPQLLFSARLDDVLCTNDLEIALATAVERGADWYRICREAESYNREQEAKEAQEKAAVEQEAILTPDKSHDRFQVVYETSAGRLAREVNDALANGWHLAGAMQIAEYPNEGYLTFFQPMIKYA